VIMESTYGNREHASITGTKEELARVVRETAARGGKVLIPAFAVGRTQEIVYDLHQLADAGQIPKIPIAIDSPLATKATDVFARNSDLFDASEPYISTHAGAKDSLFQFPMVRYTDSVEESKALDQQSGPAIIIAASGMAEAGRILHHLANGAGDPKNTVLVVGFMGQGTLGRRIVEKQPMLRVYGEQVPLRARVEIINGYSAHAGKSELVSWIDGVRSTSPKLGDVWLVHGEPEAQDALTGVLTPAGYRVHAPTPGTIADF
jgi:metallo-beta-lactamase family protein